jgi:hypothetical protein
MLGYMYSKSNYRGKTYHRRLHGHLPIFHLQKIRAVEGVAVNYLQFDHRQSMNHGFLHRRTGES